MTMTPKEGRFVVKLNDGRHYRYSDVYVGDNPDVFSGDLSTWAAGGYEPQVLFERAVHWQTFNVAVTDSAMRDLGSEQLMSRFTTEAEALAEVRKQRAAAENVWGEGTEKYFYGYRKETV